MNSLREKVISHLEEKGNYSPDVDDFFVDELISNIELSLQTLEEIKATGISQEYIYKPGLTITRVNPLISAYQMFQRNIHQCSSKLGINRADRLKLKLIEAKEEDDFDKDF
jgi:phage terminase small subunit